MKETKKYVESSQLQIEDLVRKSRVELEENGKVPSISLTSDRKQNDRIVYTSNLLKKIIHKDNMDEAFKRVKRNTVGRRWIQMSYLQGILHRSYLFRKATILHR